MKLVIILALVFPLAAMAQTDLVPCVTDGKAGYCDAKNEMVIAPVFEKALPFRGQIAPVVQNGSWYFISKKGHIRFHTQQSAEFAPPEPEKGLYTVRYFDPIFAQVTEYYNRNGYPVKIDSAQNLTGDTLPYIIFNPKSAIDLAKSKLGTPYGLNGLDCSGFMRTIFKTYGINLPYFAREMAERGREIELTACAPGDLIFFKGADLNDATANHVGMVLSNKSGEIQFIHTSSSKGVKINKYSDSYFKMRYLKCRRIFG